MTSYVRRPRPALALAFAAVLFGACGSSGTGAQLPDGPVSATPGGDVRAGSSALHAARLDAAKQAGVEPLSVDLRELRYAGWDGCLGVREPGRACAELFVGGYIARFDAAGQALRYHLADDRFVGPVDPAKADDGSPVPAELQTDFGAVLAAYVREEHALRAKVPATEVAVNSIESRVFFDTCLEVNLPGQARCPEARIPGYMIILAVPGDTFAYYNAAPTHGVRFVDRALGIVTGQPSMNIHEVQIAMREDLAKRLNVPVAQISVVSFREVTWPDGCLGLGRPGQACTQALVPGFLAELSDPTGKVHRYHGAGNEFVPAALDPSVTPGQPLPATATATP